MEITDGIIDELVRASEEILHHDGYDDPKVKEYVYSNLRKLFKKILCPDAVNGPS